MTASTRNLAVGIFVIVALGLLGWMIVRFSTEPRVFANTYEVRMVFPDAGAVGEGGDVRVNGMVVGHVRRLEPNDRFRKGVQFITDIYRRYDIPSQAQATIQANALTLSKAAIDIAVPPGAGPALLPKDGTAVMRGELANGLAATMERMIPAAQLRQVVEDMHDLLRPLSLQQLEREQAASTQPVGGNLSTVVQRLDLVIERMNTLLGGKGDVGVTLANLRKVSEDARELSETLKPVVEDFAWKAIEVADNANRAFRTATTQLDRIGSDASAAIQTADLQLKRLADALCDNSAQLSKALATLNVAVTDVAEGKGTAGKFLTDPALYENMLLATDRLHKTIIDLQQLIQKWEAEGVQIKLK